jgi:hypothetical protein
MEKKIIESILTVIIHNLSLAFGGRSGISWLALGQAIKGHMAQGMLQGADADLVVDTVIEMEIEYYCWDNMNAFQVADIRRQIMDGVKK